MKNKLAVINVIAGLIRQPNLLLDARYPLSPDDFPERFHKVVFGAVEHARKTPEEKAAIAARQIATRLRNLNGRSMWEGKVHPFLGRSHTDETKRKLSEIGATKTGAQNNRALCGTVNHDGKIVFEFDVMLKAHDYLAGKGFQRRERYAMIHGATVRGHTITVTKLTHTKGQTTIREE